MEDASNAKVHKIAFNLLRLHGPNATHLACAIGSNLEILKCIVASHPISLLTQNKHGQTPLHIACLKASPEIIQFLIQACPGAISITDRSGKIPLHMAMETDRSLDIITSLLRTHLSTKKNLWDKTPLDFFFLRWNTLLYDHLSHSISASASFSNDDILNHPRLNYVYDVAHRILQKSNHETTFLILHHSIQTPSCTLPFLRLLLHRHPHQVHLQDDNRDNVLHVLLSQLQPSTKDDDQKCTKCVLNTQFKSPDVVVNWRMYCQTCFHEHSTSLPRSDVDKYPSISNDILTLNPKLASVPNRNDQLPLMIATVQSNHQMIESIFHAAPDAIRTRDVRFHMYPFLLAGMVQDVESDNKKKTSLSNQTKKKEVKKLPQEECLEKMTISFGLLMKDPNVVSLLLKLK